MYEHSEEEWDQLSSFAESIEFSQPEYAMYPNTHGPMLQPETEVYPPDRAEFHRRYPGEPFWFVEVKAGELHGIAIAETPQDAVIHGTRLLQDFVGRIAESADIT